MRDKFREPLIIISGVLILIAIISGGLVAYQLSSNFGNVHEITNGVSEEEEELFEYQLRENATDFQKVIYDDLLNTYANYQSLGSDANREAYAMAVVKNFIADFYTWSNKDGRTDVGGLQFITPEIQTNFRSYAIDQFYLYLNQYLNQYDAEDLLTVSNIWIEDLELDKELSLEGESDLDLEPDEGPGEIEFEENEGNDDLDDDLEEEVKVIEVVASWGYEDSYLTRIGAFQQGATFLLVEDDGILTIHMIDESFNMSDVVG